MISIAAALISQSLNQSSNQSISPQCCRRGIQVLIPKPNHTLAPSLPPHPPACSLPNTSRKPFSSSPSMFRLPQYLFTPNTWSEVNLHLPSPARAPHPPQVSHLLFILPILTPNLCNFPTLHPHPYPLLSSPTLKLSPRLPILYLVSPPVPDVLKHTLPQPYPLPRVLRHPPLVPSSFPVFPNPRKASR